MLTIPTCVDSDYLDTPSHLLDGNQVAGFCALGGRLGIPGGGNGRDHSDSAKNNAYPTNCDCPIRSGCGLLRCVRSFPLGAKIGFTIFTAFGAIRSSALGFIRFIERFRNTFKGVGYFAVGFLILICALLPSW